MSPTPSSPRTLTFPDGLRLQLAHADRFASALRALHDDAAPDDPALLWLTGRAEEIEAFVDDVTREWLAGAVGSTPAGAMIEEYLASLHAAMRPWYGEWFAPSCCGPASALGPRSRVRVRKVRERDELADTLANEALTA